jgi:hypothetical protein
MGQSLAAKITGVRHVSEQYNEEHQMKDFLLYISPTTSGKKLLEAVTALYYLPQNFKIVLTNEKEVQNSEVASWAMQNFMSRIRFSNENEQGTSAEQETSLFCYADDIDADTPEAFASAVLRISRAQI